MGTEIAIKILSTVLLGLGTVFVGLICIILLVMLLKFASGNNASAPAAAPVAAPTAPVAAPTAPVAAPAAPAAASAEIPNRQEFVAAVSAVLAEELGTDISAIRIHSIKKI